VDAKRDVGALVLRAVGKSFWRGRARATLLEAGKDPAAPEAHEGMGKISDSFYPAGAGKGPDGGRCAGSAVGAGMNMLLAADPRIVAKDARLLCGFLKRGMHPGGGHFVILSRLIGREAAAAMALFGEEVNGERAVELGLAWESVDDTAVEDRALELAQRVAADPQLARVTVATSVRRSSTARLPGTSRCSPSAPPRCGQCAARNGKGVGLVPDQNVGSTSLPKLDAGPTRIN
jgi:enoyl-CoA hydratase/carnithine racemase